MTEVTEVFECEGGVFRAMVILPDLSADPLPYNITRDPDLDDAPVYQELVARLLAGEFDAIMKPCPDEAVAQAAPDPATNSGA